jgi:choline dehydrogenase
VVFAAPSEAAVQASVPLFQTMLVTRTSEAGAAPDLQIMPRSVLATKPEASPTGATVMLFVSLVKPRSMGRLWLRSVDPAAAPAIDPGYFTHEDDLPRMIEGLRMLRRLAHTAPFVEISGAEISPGPAFGDDDAELERAILHRLETYHHPVGTCRMGPDSDARAVVDAHGRVRGVDDLRVVDASIIPEIPGANTHLATLMLAERIASWMREGS